MSFNSQISELVFILQKPGITTEGGLQIGTGAVETVTLQMAFQVITRSRSQFMSQNNGTLGALQEGDAKAVYQGDQYDLADLVSQRALVTVDGIQYQAEFVLSGMRNFKTLGLKRVKGT